MTVKTRPNYKFGDRIMVTLRRTKKTVRGRILSVRNTKGIYPDDQLYRVEFRELPTDKTERVIEVGYRMIRPRTEAEDQQDFDY